MFDGRAFHWYRVLFCEFDSFFYSKVIYSNGSHAPSRPIGEGALRGKWWLGANALVGSFET